MGRESRDRERLSGGIPLEFSESNTAVLAQVQIEHIGRVGLGSPGARAPLSIVIQH